MPKGILDGIRIIDLSRVWSGPMAVRMLADMGAEAILIDAPQARLMDRQYLEMMKKHHAGGRHFPFNGDLSIGGYGQAGKGPLYYFQGTSSQAPNKIEFRTPKGMLGMGSHKGQRINTERGDNRTALPLVPVALTDLPALLARTHPQSQQVALVNLHPIGAHVDISRIRIPIDQ